MCFGGPKWQVVDDKLHNATSVIGLERVDSVLEHIPVEGGSIGMGPVKFLTEVIFVGRDCSGLLQS